MCLPHSISSRRHRYGWPKFLSLVQYKPATRLSDPLSVTHCHLSPLCDPNSQFYGLLRLFIHITSALHCPPLRLVSVLPTDQQIESNLMSSPSTHKPIEPHCTPLITHSISHDILPRACVDSCRRLFVAHSNSCPVPLTPSHRNQ